MAFKLLFWPFGRSTISFYFYMMITLLCINLIFLIQMYYITVTCKIKMVSIVIHWYLCWWILKTQNFKWISIEYITQTSSWWIILFMLFHSFSDLSLSLYRKISGFWMSHLTDIKHLKPCDLFQNVVALLTCRPYSHEILVLIISM